jgi:hypothetical protein
MISIFTYPTTILKTRKANYSRIFGYYLHIIIPFGSPALVFFKFITRRKIMSNVIFTSLLYIVKDFIFLPTHIVHHVNYASHFHTDLKVLLQSKKLQRIDSTLSFMRPTQQQSTVVGIRRRRYPLCIFRFHLPIISQQPLPEGICFE